MDKLPMKIDNVLDDIVLIVLDGHEPLKELGVDQNKIYVRVVGYDEYGMWVDRPSFKIPIIKNGNLQSEKDVAASMLIPWWFIASIVHFPDVEGFDFPNLNTSIGFDPEGKWNPLPF